ncbi:hypothetical protein ABIG06_002236 [Bradyrhizobium sp. USDA 326]
MVRSAERASRTMKAADLACEQPNFGFPVEISALPEPFGGVNSRQIRGI